MTEERKDQISPELGKRLPLADAVQQAREALGRAVELLRQFQGDRRYPQVTRSEAERVIAAIQSADELASKLDPPFRLKS